MLKTRLTELFGLSRPIVLAALAGGATDGRLAAAVNAAGGLGLFGAVHPAGPDWAREQIRFARSHTNGRFGVGFITEQIPRHEASFRVCVEERIPIFAFSFGDPTPYVAQAKAIGAKVICQVQTPDGARLALSLGADILVAQGNEAGGHTGRLGTLPFLVQVLDMAGRTPVIASGGIATGRALAAVLAAGGEGAWIGTPLLATHEAVGVSEAHKKCIVESDGQDTVYTEVYDIMYELKFPAGIAGRARINRITREMAWPRGRAAPAPSRAGRAASSASGRRARSRRASDLDGAVGGIHSGHPNRRRSDPGHLRRRRTAPASARDDGSRLAEQDSVDRARAHGTKNLMNVARAKGLVEPINHVDQGGTRWPSMKRQETR